MKQSPRLTLFALVLATIVYLAVMSPVLLLRALWAAFKRKVKGTRK